MSVFVSEIKVDANRIVITNVDGDGIIAFHRFNHITEIVDGEKAFKFPWRMQLQ
jgi:hypothetical protein